MQLINLTGKRFYYVFVIERIENNKWNQVQYFCKCDCGKKWNVLGKCLTRGSTKSCGCHKRKETIKRETTHGMTNTPIYEIWAAMLQRCKNPNNTAYKNYGKRGITVCARWEKFEHFFSDMGNPPKGLTLDRINNDGNYEPTNCRWTTRKVQVHNRRK